MKNFRPMPETDEGRLKTCLGIPVEDPLPEEVETTYWQVERLSRLVRRTGVSDDGLIMVALLHNGGLPELSTFIETARELERNHRVVTVFRGEWVPGRYYGIKGNKILVILDDDIEKHREFDATKVRLPTDEELELIGA